MTLEKQSWWDRRTVSLDGAISILQGYADMGDGDGDEMATILQSIKNLQWVKDNPLPEETLNILRRATAKPRGGFEPDEHI